MLLRQEDAAELAAFSQQYRQARLADGWRPLTREHALVLPYGHPSGYQVLYWEVRRQSFRAFMSWLAREGPSPAAGTACELGAGTGWLSYRLAQLRFDVIAVDASLDGDFGLGVAQEYYLSQIPGNCHVGRLTLVQGSLDHPPLQLASLRLVIFNASLHYARNLAHTLRRAANALQPGGNLVVLDTPIANHPRRSPGRGDRHLGRRELQTSLVAAGLQPRWISIRRGSRWWLHQTRLRLKGKAGFAFPMVVAHNEG